MMPALSISVIIPTYQREQVLVETLQRLSALLQPGDEIVVVDQTARHELATEECLRQLAQDGAIRWYRRRKPAICASMNLGAVLAKSELLLFVDDDVIPTPSLLEAHRAAHLTPGAPPVTCGQVLQPWNAGPTDEAATFDLGFPFNYSKTCDILDLMGGNLAVRRDFLLGIGGFDEQFSGVCYRFEAEFAHRVIRETGRKIRFLPDAGLRHLQAGGGGTRAFGVKDAWSHITASVGAYYFALRCLPVGACLRHTLRRLVREPVNRNTLRRPWLIPQLYVREVVAWFWAARLASGRARHFVRDLAAYQDEAAVGQPAVDAAGAAVPNGH
jgi:GT2 family glycosyltransferase